MKFRTSLKILFKSQLVATLLFPIFAFLANSDSHKGDLLKLIESMYTGAVLFLAFSSFVYYTVGIIAHRMFLEMKFFSITPTLVLSAILSIIALAIIPDIKTLWIAPLIVLPQTLLIRHLTLKELKNNIEVGK